MLNKKTKIPRKNENAIALLFKPIAIKNIKKINFAELWRIFSNIVCCFTFSKAIITFMKNIERTQTGIKKLKIFKKIIKSLFLKKVSEINSAEKRVLKL